MLQNTENQTQTQTQDNLAVVAQNVEGNAPALFTNFSSPYLQLKDAFQRQGISELPVEMTTGCTVYNGQLKFGEDLKNSFGDFVTVEVLNLTEYEKVDLGVNPVPEEAKKFVVACKDGHTVEFEETEYSKEGFIELLKKSGYPQAKFKLRAVLHAFYVESEKGVKLVDKEIPLAIYLSPSSLKSWNAFVNTAAIRRNPTVEATGSGSLIVKITTEEKNWAAKNISWTQMKFEAVRDTSVN